MAAGSAAGVFEVANSPTKNPGAFAEGMDLSMADSFLSLLWSGIGKNTVLLEPFVVLAIVYAVRRVNRIGSASIMPEYMPPPGISPAEAGMLLNDFVGSRCVTATLVDLVSRKYLRVQDKSPEAAGPQQHHELVFELLKPEDAWHVLALHERTLLAQIFRNRTWATLEELKLSVPDVMLAMSDEIQMSLFEKGMYRSDPKNPKDTRIVMYVPAIFICLGGAAMGSYEYPALALLMAGVSMAIAFWAIHNTDFWTQKRKTTQAHLEGLRQFIDAVDADRLKRLEHYQFDALLPYAVVFGIEQKWALAFRQLGIERVDWMGDAETDSLLRGTKLTVLSSYLEPQESRRDS
jgi:hypothetical protein